MSGKRPGEARVILEGPELGLREGLASLTRGRPSERLIPRSARSWAVHLLIIPGPAVAVQGSASRAGHPA